MKKAICPFCGKKVERFIMFRGDVVGCQYCGIHTKQTNADRLRAMSEEEMAAFFAQQEYRKPVFDGWLPLCYYVMGPRMCHENGCEKCWLDWLKQEANDG